MIGWKITFWDNEDLIEAQEAVGEIVGQAIVDEGITIIPVYHNGNIKMARFDHTDKIKVIDNGRAAVDNVRITFK